MSFSFLEAPGFSPPRPSEPDECAKNIVHFKEVTQTAGLEAFAAALLKDEKGQQLLEAIFGNSPYLTRLIFKYPECLKAVCEDGADAACKDILKSLDEAITDDISAESLMNVLRQTRNRASLVIALADIFNVWSLEHVTGTLSRLAERCLQVACEWLLRDGHKRGEIVIPHPESPSKESGLVVLGMGKLGAKELNYSSDIDLIILYDPEKIEYRGRRGIQYFFVRLAQQLVDIMQKRTGEGYVFRTDLRLRPDPASTPSALALDAAITYYESVGQNWERAAMIKARPVAGDAAAGEDFLNAISGYVWRRHLDFESIRDIHAIKRQIDVHKSSLQTSLYGLNIKLAPGGIRNIEFYAQTQQLIWGGREPELRTPDTCAALDALVESGRVQPETALELKEAYHFLRRLEHRIQMIGDQQTHDLPEEKEGMESLVIFMGFETREAFETHLHSHMETVRKHYAVLFEDAPTLAPAGNLVFTGVEDDPATLKTLREMGYERPEHITATVRSWHHGNRRATRTTRAREILTELVPEILEKMGKTAHPDEAFSHFDQFLGRLPGGVQLFSLFRANPNLIALIADIMGSAPRQAMLLSRYPELLDVVISGEFYTPLLNKDGLREELEQALHDAEDQEDILRATRTFKQEKEFQIGIQLLKKVIDVDTAGEDLSDIADVIIQEIKSATEAEFAKRHGHIPGGGFAVIALGKLGGRELTFSSDLDLMFAYDYQGEEAWSDGKKSLSANVYYERLTQRFIGALTSLTGEGRLYEVDTRLRPFGEDGPIASGYHTMLDYYGHQAWTFEMMALTRARVVASPPDLEEKLNNLFKLRLQKERRSRLLAADIHDMRLRILNEHHTDDPWAVRHVRGGLVDAEFITQYLELLNAKEYFEVVESNTLKSLHSLVDKRLWPKGNPESFITAVQFIKAVQAMTRLTYGKALEEEKAMEGLRDLLARWFEEPSFELLKTRLLKAEAIVLQAYKEVIESQLEN